MSVTFCGHAQVNDIIKVRNRLFRITKNLIEDGERTFYLGGYGEFDRLAAAVLSEHKENYPEIERILVLPYLDIKPDMKDYDASVYPPLEHVPRRYAILRRNMWMVDQAGTLVGHVTHAWGGAAKTFEYVQRRGKRIVPC